MPAQPLSDRQRKIGQRLIRYVALSPLRLEFAAKEWATTSPTQPPRGASFIFHRACQGPIETFAILAAIYECYCPGVDSLSDRPIWKGLVKAVRSASDDVTLKRLESCVASAALRFPVPPSLAFPSTTPSGRVATKAKSESDGELLTEEQAAKIAGVSKRTIRRLITSGRLQAKDYGTGAKHYYRIEQAALAELQTKGIATVNGKRQPTPRKRHISQRSSKSASLNDLLPVVSAGAKGIEIRSLIRGGFGRG